MAVTQRRRLFDELNALGLAARGGGVRGLIARRNDDTDFFHVGLENLFDEDLQRGFGHAIPVHQALQGQRTLSFARGGDDGFFDFHGRRAVEAPEKSQKRACPSIRVSAGRHLIHGGFKNDAEMERRRLVRENS
jgi:hypothetical protein